MNCEICQQVVKFGKVHVACEKSGFFEQGGLWYSRRIVNKSWRIVKVCGSCRRPVPDLGLQVYCKKCKQKMGDD